MTDDNGEDVPVTEPPASDPANDPGPEMPGWASPPAWGHTPQPPNWQEPTNEPPVWQAPAPGQPAWQQPTSEQASWPQPQTGGAGSGSGGGWNYGYGGLWTPPPEPPAQPPNSARRAIAAIAVVILILVSGSVGAVISAAVHDNNPSTSSTSPFGNGSNNNPFGSNPVTPTTTPSADTNTIAAKVTPALVNIYTTIQTSTGSGQAAGTGMVISSSGEVLTNNHVIADASTVRVELVSSGAMHSAKVLGYDVKDDIALLQIDGVSDLPTVSFADASKVAVGDPVVAMGNAGGKGGQPTVSTGSVTATQQKVTAGDQGTGDSETLTGMIEISAPIEPGDSGGALANSNGQVIGMNTAAATSDRFSGQESSTAFAIPINRAVRIATQIRDNQESANVHVGDRALLGVRVQDIETQTTNCDVAVNSGAFVFQSESGSPADSAGLGKCDVITGVGGKNVASTSDLNAAMFQYHPDETVTVHWVDESGGSHSADVTLIAGPPA
jgi:S1-C subfamily serine protease